MPIRRAEYPDNWEQISDYVRFERAGGRCERCGVAHGEIGARDGSGVWRTREELERLNPSLLADTVISTPAKYQYIADGQAIRYTKIALTVSHFDRDTSNNSDWNLFAYCQACHLWHDRLDNWQRRRRNISRRQEQAGQKIFTIYRGAK